MTRRALLVVDHGSRRAEANAQLETLAALLRQRLGPDVIVETAHLELVPPTFEEGLRRCVLGGAVHVVVHPFFLAPGRHATEDIPRLVAEARATHPGVTIEVTELLGLHDAVVDAVLNRSGFRTKP